jgi:hypothetical protein
LTQFRRCVFSLSGVSLPGTVRVAEEEFFICMNT